MCVCFAPGARKQSFIHTIFLIKQRHAKAIDDTVHITSLLVIGYIMLLYIFILQCTIVTR